MYSFSSLSLHHQYWLGTVLREKCMNTVQTWQSRTGPREKYRYVAVLLCSCVVCTYAQECPVCLRQHWQRRPSAVGFVLSLTHFTSCCQISNMSICLKQNERSKEALQKPSSGSVVSHTSHQHTHTYSPCWKRSLLSFVKKNGFP